MLLSVTLAAALTVDVVKTLFGIKGDEAAFVGAAAVPVWAAFLTSDLFNFALVFFAYFLWLYKEVLPRDHAAPPSALAGRRTDVWAAALLGAVTYSKLSNGPLILPLVILA